MTNLPEILDEKSLSRKSRSDSDLFAPRVSITTIKTTYLIAHLTPADISLLSYFYEITEELSIVNGSFVTLGKPFKGLWEKGSFKRHDVTSSWRKSEFSKNMTFIW